MRKRFSPLTLVIVAIFSIVNTGRRLRLTTIKSRVTVFLFVPPSGRFFCPENGRAAAGVRCRVPEAQGRGRDIEGKFRGSHPGQTTRMAEKNPETWPAEPGRKVRQ